MMSNERDIPGMVEIDSGYAAGDPPYCPYSSF
jgi:hypothetical protein